MQIHAVLILSTLFLVVSVSAQNSDKALKLQLAQQLEQANEWQRATLLYEDLYNSEPMNYTYLDGLRRCYSQLKEYSKAIAIVQRWLTLHPKDIGLLCTLGGLYYDSGYEKIADSLWNSVVAIEPNNANTYRLVANEMMAHRLYDDCIRMYIEGRKKNSDSSLYADELGMMYSALQRYADATSEYIRMVEKAPDNLSFAQSRISSFTSRPEGLSAAIAVTRNASSGSPNNIALHRLLAWLFMEEKKSTPALDEYRTIDKLARANGNELFSFAQRLFQERFYQTASFAFLEFTKTYSNSPLFPTARMGFARSIEELSVLYSDSIVSSVKVQSFESDTLVHESNPSYSRAVALYQEIVNAYPSTELAAQALFRIGIIKYEQFFDLDGALSAFDQVKRMSFSPTITYDAIQKEGEVQIARNDLQRAQMEFNSLASAPQPLYQDQAAYLLAETDYYAAKFDSALSKLKRFNTHIQTDLANDALQLQYFIQENQKTAPEALTAFAHADLYIQQRKYSEALVQFEDIRRRYPETLLLDDAIMKVAELQLKLKRVDEALTNFRLVADSLQFSILKDRAQFRIGETYQNVLKNIPAAIGAYEKLLAQFPNSLYTEEVRKRIRLLRGDNL